MEKVSSHEEAVLRRSETRPAHEDNYKELYDKEESGGMHIKNIAPKHGAREMDRRMAQRNYKLQKRKTGAKRQTRGAFLSANQQRCE